MKRKILLRMLVHKLDPHSIRFEMISDLLEFRDPLKHPEKIHEVREFLLWLWETINEEPDED